MKFTDDEKAQIEEFQFWMSGLKDLDDMLDHLNKRRAGLEKLINKCQDEMTPAVRAYFKLQA